MFLGIDIGSSSSKAALMDNDGKLLGTKVVNIGTGTNGIEIALSELSQGAGLHRRGYSVHDSNRIRQNDL